MAEIKLSVVIPSWKDKYLKNTIQDLLKHSELGDALEIIAVLDGYWVAPDDIVNDPRVRYVHLGKNRGMRGAINAGVSVARGEFLMRTDEHCKFDQGFDRKMVEVCQPNWILNARRYFLDVKKWKRMNLPPVDHEKLVIQGGKKFSGAKWPERDEQMKDELVSETLAMQGSVWVMPHAWWDKVIGELQTEGYGAGYQDSHEMSFKTWQAGGKLMLNKATWYAHRHRDFGRTHNHGTEENPWIPDESYAYALQVWGDYYRAEIAPKWGL